MWDKVFKNVGNKIFGRQPLKNLKGYDLLTQSISLQIFERLSSKNFTWFILEHFVPCLFQAVPSSLNFCCLLCVVQFFGIYSLYFHNFYYKNERSKYSNMVPYERFKMRGTIIVYFEIFYIDSKSVVLTSLVFAGFQIAFVFPSLLQSFFFCDPKNAASDLLSKNKFIWSDWWTFFLVGFYVWIYAKQH